MSPFCCNSLQLNNADVQRAVMGALKDSPEFDDLLNSPELVRRANRLQTGLVMNLPC